MTAHGRLAATLAFVWISGSATLTGETLSREEVAKQGKAASALIEITPGRMATAFCVHPSGLFVTTEALIRFAGSSDSVKLVRDSGTKTQKVYKANVIRRDAQLDLALLRVEGPVDFPSLNLGSDEDLAELQDLVVCGFPRRLMERDNPEYPNITIGLENISALRRGKDTTIARIQLDKALDPGHAGGPALDLQGKVIGVVTFTAGQPNDQAIPVNHVSRFLARPDFAFTPPKDCKTNQAVTFEAIAVSLIPNSAPLEVELVLSSSAGTERRFSMKGSEGRYQTEAVPFPETGNPLVVLASMQYRDGSVSGLAEDRTFSVGEQTIKLSHVRSLRPLGANAIVELNDRRRIEGSLLNLDELPMKVGGQSLSLNLKGAIQLDIDSSDAMTAATCTVIARQGGKEVGRITAPVYLEGVARASLEALREGKFIRPPRSAAPISYLRVVSSPGEFIGQGKSYSYGGGEFVVQRSDRGVQILEGESSGWRINFGGPRGGFLEVGEYLDAKRYGLSDASPGMEFAGHGRGANKITGKFVVWELEFDGNRVARLAVDFIQYSEETPQPLYGMLRFNSLFH